MGKEERLSSHGGALSGEGTLASGSAPASASVATSAPVAGGKGERGCDPEVMQPLAMRVAAECRRWFGSAAALLLAVTPID